MTGYRFKSTGTDGALCHTHVGLQPIDGVQVVHIFRKALVKPDGDVKSWEDSGYKTIYSYKGFSMMVSLIGIKIDSFATITEIVCKLLDEK